MNETKTRGLGWIPDLPDFRDYTEETRDIRAILAPTGLTVGRGAGEGASPSPGRRRPEALGFAGRGPGRPRLVHGPGRRRRHRILRAEIVRAPRRGVAALPL